MKKFLMLLIFAQIILLPTFALAKSLIYSDHEPLGNMRTKFLHEIFFRQIEKESEGKIKIAEHWNSELSTGYDALKKVKSGEIDIAVVVPEYDAANLPLHQLFKSFPLGPTGNNQSEFLKNIYKEIPALNDELYEQNIIPIYVAMGYPVAFYSVKPLDSPTNMKNQKWRSASFWHKDQLKNVGAIPVTIQWGEKVYNALKSGELDGLMVNIDSGYDINAQDAAPYVLTSKKLWLGHIYIIAINKNVWENLPQSEKLAIQRAAEFSYRKMGKIADKSFKNQIATLKSLGVKVRILNNAELSNWEKATRFTEVQNEWIADRETFKNVRDKLRERIGEFERHNDK